ncbi:Bug family tripartite tricarboxylate transporter substrate binding protein [Variovorax sp. HJSM1_2]|uniref:Bug family tripartite tricarboxylate transporter substrate binding protein n=1 Tax=Variovorax sp. HJSM1_2 TaxID=3366263 RepID=UPI003BB9E536
MKPSLFGLALVFAAGLTFANAGHADTYPSRGIQIVVPAAPGGSPDILARILGQALSVRLGQSVSIENKPGGAGNIAAQAVARAAPDGYTLLVAADGISINQTLFAKLPFDARTSFAPIVHAISSPQVFAVNAAVPARSLKEFLQLAKTEPGKYALASPAVGTTGQLGVLLLQTQAQIQVKPVVYRSAQPALTDVLGAHADGIIVTIAPALPFIREGKLRALGVSTAKRSAALPDVPTFVEQGLPDFNFDSWQGFVAPAGTPQAIIDRLNREFNAVLQDPEVRKQLLAQAFDPAGGPPEAFRKVIEDSIGSWGKVIQANNIRLD